MKVAKPTEGYQGVYDALAIVIAVAFLASFAVVMVNLIGVFENLYIPF